jgi:hypothetical protein
LFNLLRIPLPPAERRAVQAADDRDAYRFFRFRDMIDVRLGIHFEVWFVGIIVERVTREFTAVSRTAAHAMICRTKLFLKKRMENHCRCPGVLHSFNIVELFR